MDIIITEQLLILLPEPQLLPSQVRRILGTPTYLSKYSKVMIDDVSKMEMFSVKLEKYPTELSVQMEKYPIIGSKSGRRILVKRAFSDGKSKKHKGYFAFRVT